MTFLKRKTTTHNITMSFLLLIVLFLSFGAFTIKGLFTLGNLTQMIYHHPLVVSNASLGAALNTTKMHRSMKDFVLANSAKEAKRALQAVSENERIVYRQLDIIREEILGDEGRALEIQTRQLFKDWEPIRQEVVMLFKAGDIEGATLITQEKGADHVVKLETKMQELTSYARKKAAGFLERAEASQTRLEKTTVILTLSGVLLSIIIAITAIYLSTRAEKKNQGEKNRLQKAIDEIKTLRGIIPICSHCKQIRDDKGLWKRLEEYILAHSDAKFSHGICPDCVSKHYSELYGSETPAEKQKK